MNVLRHTLFGLLLFFQTLPADQPEPALLIEYRERGEKLFQQAKERLKVIADSNQKRLEKAADEGIKQQDPTLHLWAERELRLHPINPFCNLSRPKRVLGYPENLLTLSANLRTELTEFLTQLKKEKEKWLLDAENAFEARVRDLVRANEIETAVSEQDAFKELENQKVLKDLNRQIQSMERLLSGKKHQALWRRPKNDSTPAPPDALFLFDAKNPAFQTFLKNISVLSKGSPHRGTSGVRLGNQVKASGQRGLTLLALVDNEVVLQEHYDTYESKSEGLRMVADVKVLPYGSFVVLFAHDDATRRFPGEAQSTLFRLGASQGLADLPYRSAYILIGIKGLKPGDAVELHHNEQIDYPHLKSSDSP